MKRQPKDAIINVAQDKKQPKRSQENSMLKIDSAVNMHIKKKNVNILPKRVKAFYYTF